MEGKPVSNTDATRTLNAIYTFATIVPLYDKEQNKHDVGETKKVQMKTTYAERSDINGTSTTIVVLAQEDQVSDENH
ncbi:hypothetical protein MAR_018029 [Mya arenaria]|uniref:Uncharacterized protein n=1 Tax=Mya arenaria TaxID=6604 RepID=A0ABY7EGZ0_MYAAR|nr:hypothetical protein MAR_018029 [Mya arenaria]